MHNLEQDLGNLEGLVEHFENRTKEPERGVEARQAMPASHGRECQLAREYAAQPERRGATLRTGYEHKCREVHEYVVSSEDCESQLRGEEQLNGKLSAAESHEMDIARDREVQLEQKKNLTCVCTNPKWHG